MLVLVVVCHELGHRRRLTVADPELTFDGDDQVHGPRFYLNSLRMTTRTITAAARVLLGEEPAMEEESADLDPSRIEVVVL